MRRVSSSGQSSWRHKALPVLRRLDQSENKRVYELKNEMTYHCIPPVCVKTLSVAAAHRQFLFIPRFILVLSCVCLTIKLDNKIKLIHVFLLLYLFIFNLNQGFNLNRPYNNNNHNTHTRLFITHWYVMGMVWDVWKITPCICLSLSLYVCVCVCVCAYQWPMDIRHFFKRKKTDPGKRLGTVHNDLNK